MNSQQPIYEFLLWNNCNNCCNFCHQKANKNKYPGKFPNDDGKLKSLQLVQQFIQTEVPEKSHILLMGGELFDTKLSKRTEKEFLNLAKMVADRMVINDQNLLYLNTNLIYSDMSFLHSFLDVFKNENFKNRIHFTTSYDIAYRYKNNFDKYLVENNMIKITKEYPDIFRVANCIMTDKMCYFLNSNIDFLSKFSKQYGFNLNLIPYIRLHQEQAPLRKDVLSLLMKINNYYPNYIKKYISELSIKQERILWEYNNNKLLYASSKNSECNHNENFKRVYKNDNHCFICDCIRLFENI